MIHNFEKSYHRDQKVQVEEDDEEGEPHDHSRCCSESALLSLMIITSGKGLSSEKQCTVTNTSIRFDVH
jgi:hypothetical protein